MDSTRVENPRVQSQIVESILESTTPLQNAASDILYTHPVKYGN